MERLEILNEDGSGTGVYKDREAVHRDGDLHGSSLIWIVRNRRDNGDFDVLLQRRSEDKDSYPGRLDTSCAGHVPAGETFLTAAVRELEEELGICANEEDLLPLFYHRSSWEAVFHGRKFCNNEIGRIYLFIKPVPATLDGFCRKEISALCWQGASAVLAALREGDPAYCVQQGIFEKLMAAVPTIRHYTIHISDYWSVPGAGSYAGSDEWTYHASYDFFGSEEAAVERAKQYIREFYEDTNPNLAGVTYWLT